MRPSAFLLTLLLLPPGVGAQELQLTTSSALLDQATISDIDFVRSTTPKWLFTLELKTVPPGPSSIDVVLLLTGDLDLASGESAQEIFQYRSSPLSVVGSRTLTNLDLARPGIRQDYTFDESKIEQSGLKDIALSGSRLPAGTYTINITVLSSAGRLPGNELAHGKIVFVLTNPSSVELLFPPDGDPATGQFPLFQWFYDGALSRISVYERLPEQRTLEEAATGVPQLVEEVRGMSFQYPTSGVRVLEPGKSYVWFVEGLRRSSGGTLQVVRSPLRSFTVSSNGGLPPEPSILELLEQALGPKYKSVFDRIRSEHLSPTGELTLDGSPISVQELAQLIAEIREHPDLVQMLHVE
jgi:hypothetical protein